MSTPFSSGTQAPPLTALVTGAGKRLGREIALGLAKAGWRVAIHYRSSEAEALETAKACLALNPATQTLNPQSFVFKADLADEHATRQLLPQVVKQLGRVDAQIFSKVNPFQSARLEPKVADQVGGFFAAERLDWSSHGVLLFS